MRPTREELPGLAALRMGREAKTPRQRARALRIVQGMPTAAAQVDAEARRFLSRELLAQVPGRVGLVTAELAGFSRTGGIGTAMGGLAELLAAAGHEVHILFCPFVGHKAADAYWLDYWKSLGISVDYLPRWTYSGRNPESEAFSVALSARLAAGDWDLIHFHDNGGYAAAALLLRAAGLLFHDTRIAVTLHGPTLWHRQGNRQPWNPNEAVQSHLEAVSVDLADVVICPSRHILDWSRRNFRSNAPHIVVPNAMSGDSRRFGRISGAQRRVKTVAYFGRIEPRKGIDTFLDAVDQVLAAGMTDFEVMFLGKLEAPYSEEELARRTKSWPCRTRLVTNHSMLEAIELLRSEDCIVVLPSRVDNSPFTVYECLENGIPFLASNVGGIPELVRKEDRQRVLVAGGASEYAERLLEALTVGASPASLAFDPRNAAVDLLAVHANLIERGRLSRGGTELVDPADVTVIAYGGEEDREAAEVLAGWSGAGAEILSASVAGYQVGEGGGAPFASSEAGMLNRLAKKAARRHLLFCHASVTPRVEALDALLRTLTNSGADAVVCGYAVGGSQAEVLVCAGPPELSVSEDVYGARIFLVRKAAFLKAKSFLEDTAAAPLLEWELLNRMAASGCRIVGIPVALAALKTAPPSPTLTGPQSLLLRTPWIEAAPGELQGFLRMTLYPDTAGAPVRSLSRAAFAEPDLELRELLARRARTRAKEGDAVTNGSGLKIDPLTTSDSRSKGLNGAEGEVLPATRGESVDTPAAVNGVATYFIRSASDAAACDFLVADDLIDRSHCRSLSQELGVLERRLGRAQQGNRRDNRFLRIGEVLSEVPDAGARIAETLGRAVEATREFYGLETALYPDRVRLITMGDSPLVLPTPELFLQGRSDPAAGKVFAGLLCITDDFSGGEAYFPDLEIAVVPRVGRFIATPIDAGYTCHMLGVRSGVERVMAFAMTADSHWLSTSLKPFFLH